MRSPWFRGRPVPAPRGLPSAWVLALLLGAVTAVHAATPTSAAGEPELKFPVTFDQVWYRTGQKRGWLGPKLVGDLTITTEVIEVSSGKVDIVVPLADLLFVSLGTMSGDPDTDWAVFSVERERTTERIGLRDGKQLGYGTRTGAIYRAIREAARRSAVAQFRAPDGLQPYTELDHQFAIAIPRDWSSYHQEVVSIDRIPLWGTVVFSPTIPRLSSGLTDREGGRKAIRRGATVAWVVERAEARKSMRCAELGEKAITQVREWLATSSIFGGVVDGVLATAPRETRIDRCAGLRWTGSTATPGGVEGRVALVVASDDRTVFAFALLAPAEGFDEQLSRFEQGLATIRFAVAH